MATERQIPEEIKRMEMKIIKTENPPSTENVTTVVKGPQGNLLLVQDERKKR